MPQLQLLNSQLFSWDALSNPTGAMKVYNAKPVMVCNMHLRPVHMIPGQLIALGQLTDPGANFASVHGLTPVTVHMSFSLPRGQFCLVHGLTPVTVHMSFSLPWDNFERRVTRCTTPDNPPCRGNFSPCEQNAKVAPGQE